MPEASASAQTLWSFIRPQKGDSSESLPAPSQPVPLKVLPGQDRGAGGVEALQNSAHKPLSIPQSLEEEVLLLVQSEEPSVYISVCDRGTLACVGVSADVVGHYAHGPTCECLKLSASSGDREDEGAPKRNPSFPGQGPGVHEPGAPATVQPLFAWKESQIAMLQKRKALVSVLASRGRKTCGWIPEKKTPPEAARNTRLNYASLLSRPQPPADLPDLSSASGRNPTARPSRPGLTLL